MIVKDLGQRTNKKITKGVPYPLGATPEKNGVNFALFSAYARAVYLLLFENPDSEASDVIKLEHKTDNIWHAFVEGLRTGQLYAYRVDGDYDPKNGKRFNPAKLLIDPYAKALTGKCRNTDNLLLPYDTAAPEKDLVIDRRDNMHAMPKCIVVDDAFDWQGDKKPAIPLEKLLIYEVSVKGFTAHVSSGVKHPGTYLGFIEKISYLKELGINVVELLPVHEFHMRGSLLDKGLSEYWGYNTIGFFAPESSYGTDPSKGNQVTEFKTLVRELHKAGIEVILDVVYNHTGEGGELGPSLCFRGIDNLTYYALAGTSKGPYRSYRNDTGCGNTINVENPLVLQMVLDSLRYWAEVVHVDGFRFDLASVLARVKGKYSSESAFFSTIQKDPVLSKVKMIAEPWDLTTYQVGNFPEGWSEWNGKFRDTVRRFLKGDGGQIKDLAQRITGSADLYGDDGRTPCNSINFVTCHDGFPLHDLYSYNQKHNGANLEDNRDGSDDNSSWNCGAEGETDNPNILKLRKQMVKNALCCLLFSSGTPMILGGDEILRTQKGNNNVYCQDNEISWFNWEYVKKNTDILEFCKKAIGFRKRYPILQRCKFFLGMDTDNDQVPDIAWFDEALNPPSWDNPQVRILCYQLDGSEVPSKLGNYHLFFIYNADSKLHSVRLPQYEGMKWFRVVDTSLAGGKDFCGFGQEVLHHPQDPYEAVPRSTVVLLAQS